MKTSARNEFLGKITGLKNGPVNSEVILDIGGGSELAAIITQESMAELGLKLGGKAYALIKAPWVIITTDSNIKTSARNKLCGKVTHCQTDAVNAEVVIEIPGGRSIAAIVTKESIESMGLRVGASASAHIKSSHVVLAVAE